MADDFYFFGIAKCFEVYLEYCWKYFKRHAESEGIDIVSPKDAIRAAGQLELIEDVELWIRFLNARNIAVHDYLGVPNKNYLEIIKSFADEVGKMKIVG